MNIKRRPVAFNVDDQMQRELLEWCDANIANFSGCVKSLLFSFKNGKTAGEPLPAPEVYTPVEPGGYEVIGDIF